MNKKGSSIHKYVAAGVGLTALTLGGYYLLKKLPSLLCGKSNQKKSEKIQCLTKIKAEKRASHITGNLNYKLLLNLEEKSYYTGIVQINFVIKSQNEEMFLDYNGESIQEMIVNHMPLKTNSGYTEYWDGSFIRLPKDSLVPGNNLIEIRYKNQYCKDGQGLHSLPFLLVVDTDNKQYIYSNLEPYWASRLFPCMDQPNLKGSYDLIVINPKSHTCIANETPKVMASYDGSDVIKEFGDTDINILTFLKEITSEGRNLWIFNKTKSISTYLFAVISGPFKEVKCENTYNNIQMSCFCRESLFDQMKECAQQLFTVTIEAMKFYEHFFQYPYPFSKYDSIFCPEYNQGAMENVGAVTFNDLYLYKGDVSLEKISRRAQTITHELAHMWFGNLVTMDWWEDLWLNESFADFAALHCLRKISKQFSFKLSDFGVMSNMRKIWGYREDGKISTHPIAAEVHDTDEASSIFDGITYSKGQAVIRQLLNLLGPDNFSQGISEYFKKYEYKNATLVDFLNSLQTHFQLKEDSEYTLNDWALEWLKEPSYNEMTPVWNPLNVSEQAELEIVQGFVQKSYNHLRHHKMQVAFYGENGVLLEVKQVFIKAQESTKITYNGALKVKAVLLNYEDDCFVKVSLDETSLEFFKNNLHKIPEILSKNLIWRALYDMVHDGKIASAELIQIAVEQVPKETESVLVSLIFMFCKLAIEMFTPIKAKPQLKKKLFQMILNQVSNKKLDTFSKMTLIDELVVNAVCKEELTFMIKFVDKEDQNKEEQEELKLSQQQKWAIGEAVARSQDFERNFKQLTVEVIAKQDESSDGKLCLQTCQIAINQTEAEKDEIWKQFLDQHSSKSLFQLNAMMKGFNLEETWETSRKFHDLFFSNLIQVFESRQLQFAEHYFALLFPKTEDYAYLIAKVEETMGKVPYNMHTLNKLLTGVRDEIDVKMRAVEAYSKFEAISN